MANVDNDMTPSFRVTPSCILIVSLWLVVVLCPPINVLKLPTLTNVVFTCVNEDVNHVIWRDSGGVAVYLRNDMAADVEPVIGFSNGVDETLGLYSKSKSLKMWQMSGS